MATFSAQQLLLSTGVASTPGIPADIPGQQYFGNPPTGITYVMRGEDAAINGTYDVWKVTGTADFTASSYHGALATPLRDVIVQSKA